MRLVKNGPVPAGAVDVPMPETIRLVRVHGSCHRSDPGCTPF